jgi:hypothetical protein
MSDDIGCRKGWFQQIKEKIAKRKTVQIKRKSRETSKSQAIKECRGQSGRPGGLLKVGNLQGVPEGQTIDLDLDVGLVTALH